jgi:Flp pilus assembly protein TadG
MHKRVKGFMADRSGALSTTVALVMVVFLAMAALVIDYGHMAWVQSELKAAADAGALAGAKSLVPYVGTPATPDWISGQNKATQTVLLNRADTEPLTDAQVEYGFWSMTAKTLQSPGIAPTNSHLPAIRVTIAKAAGQNNGPIRMFFASIFGVNTWDLCAQAVAVVSGPYSVPPGGAFPLAMPKDLLDQYQWDRDPPQTVQVGGFITDGQWTSFFIGANDVPTIRDLMDSGNPSNLAVGDNIWIEPGIKTTLYDEAATKIGQTVTVPVVSTHFDTHAYTPILGFASFVIDVVQGGDDKYIQGHFIKNIITDASSGGPVFGTFVPSAKLVN